LKNNSFDKNKKASAPSGTKVKLRGTTLLACRIGQAALDRFNGRNPVPATIVFTGTACHLQDGMQASSTFGAPLTPYRLTRCVPGSLADGLLLLLQLINY
jgi:hypothetical protein